MTLVYGAGKSGLAAAKLLLSHKIPVLLYDGDEKKDEKQIKEEHPYLADAVCVFGAFPKEDVSQWDRVVVSPGVPLDQPDLLFVKEKGVEIIGEIELAYRYGKGRILAITGTNGKTTTTSLVGEIMKRAYEDVRVVGNIGIPYTEMVEGSDENTVTVAEISSFQLETVVDFHPDVTAFLNLTEDHLNRHHTMENYGAAKAAITKNQTAGDTCVLNYDCDYTRELAERITPRAVFFSSTQKLEDGWYLDEDKIMWAEGGKSTVMLTVKDLHLVGVCNYENVMAAMAMAQAFGVPMAKIIEAVKDFHAVEHRIEYVRTVGDVKYYNDSKGTNPDAAIQGIRAMDGPTYLIGGGYDKQSDYTPWIREFSGKVKKLVLIGATKYDIAASCEALGFQEYVFCDSLKEAVLYCHTCADGGENVLLSPACASWDMFPNYEERGRQFKEIVGQL